MKDVGCSEAAFGSHHDREGIDAVSVPVLPMACFQGLANRSRERRWERMAQ